MSGYPIFLEYRGYPDILVFKKQCDCVLTSENARVIVLMNFFVKELYPSADEPASGSSARKPLLGRNLGR